MAKLPTKFLTAFEAYKVADVLGEGGTGRVFKVEGTDGKAFALKCLLPERVSVERRQRFKNEILFCEKSEHPNIVRVIDSGVVEIDGTPCPFYVMPLFSATLADLMASGINSADVLSLYSQVLNGIEAAHLQGVWHRDLKPENVLYDAADKRLVVADFGIARFTDYEHATFVKTKRAAKLANLAYSAPEQRQKGASVDQRADIFALGLILNEMFTRQIIQGTGFKTIESVAPDNAYLDALVEKMVRNDPAQRFASVQEVKKELVARGKEFVVFQEIQSKTKQVVPKYEPGEVAPVEIVGVDMNGSDLVMELNRVPEGGWIQCFGHPRENHSNMMGYGPTVYRFVGKFCAVSHVREEITQNIVDQFNQFASMATRSYRDELKRVAQEKEAAERAKLKAELEEAERRKRVLQNIKLKK